MSGLDIFLALGPWAIAIASACGAGLAWRKAGDAADQQDALAENDANLRERLSWLEREVHQSIPATMARLQAVGELATAMEEYTRKMEAVLSEEGPTDWPDEQTNTFYERTDGHPDLNAYVADLGWGVRQSARSIGFRLPPPLRDVAVRYFEAAQNLAERVYDVLHNERSWASASEEREKMKAAQAALIQAVEAELFPPLKSGGVVETRSEEA